LALIAGYERGIPWARAGADTSLGARAALWGIREILSLVVASLLAGLATTPYAAFHFHRVAPYGVLANLLAMPIVSGWVMPMGILGVVTIPFGFDGLFWRQMGYGIEWMDFVALWVSSLPGAFGRVSTFGTGPLLVATLGLLLICLLKTPLRWSGALFVALSIVLALRTPQPDILVAADGRTFAVRGENGKLSFHRSGSDGCVGKLPDGRLVSYALAAEAFEEDCRRVAVVVSVHAAPPSDCGAFVIGRDLRRARGALALRRDGGDGFVIESARPENFDRPWAPRPPRSRAEVNSDSDGNSPTASSPPRDATPKSEDLQADD